MLPSYPDKTTMRMRSTKRTRITTNTLVMVLWLTTVQRRRRTKLLWTVIVRTTI